MNSNPLDNEYLTINDVSLVPKLGKLASRSEAKLKPFIYSAPMDKVTGYDLTKAMLELGEYPVISRFLGKEELDSCIRDFIFNPNCFFAVGLDTNLINFLDRVNTITSAESIQDQRAINFALDIAHGDMYKAHVTTKTLRESPFTDKIMSGSICTPGAAIRAIEAGCTHLRVGVGPGSACTTRLMTGVGIPNLSAVYLIRKALVENKLDAEVIADGGIKYPGDAVKYLSAGASGIMLGNILSKVTESTGWESTKALETEDIRRWKFFRGQASSEFQREKLGKHNTYSEGISLNRIYLDPLVTTENIITNFRNGIRSAISYLGLSSMDELKPENSIFIRVTSNGYTEGTPHGLKE